MDWDLEICVADQCRFLEMNRPLDGTFPMLSNESPHWRALSINSHKRHTPTSADLDRTFSRTHRQCFVFTEHLHTFWGICICKNSSLTCNISLWPHTLPCSGGHRRNQNAKPTVRRMANSFQGNQLSDHLNILF